MEDIYDIQKRLESVRQKISDSEMIESNKGKILEFANCCLANGVGKNKTSRYLYDLHNLSVWLNKPFEEATKKDMEAIMVKLQETKYSEWTKKGYKIITKKFYKWLRNSKEYPEEVEWIRSNIKENHKKLPEEILNEEEVMKMIDNAVCLRDKAMISVLYDCGCRIGELLTLKIKDIEEAEYGAKISLTGKTGMRKVLLIFSAPYLLEWINNHPDKKPVSYAWVKNNGQRIGYARVRNLLKDTAERAKIEKKVNPHNFRHSRATYYASRLREREMMEYFGWRKSDTVGIYVHLSGDAVDNAILRSQGIIKEKDKSGTLLKSKKCARCKKINKPTDKFCSMCSMPLDEEIANELDLQEALKLWDEISESQELNLPPYIYNVYKEVILPCYNEVKRGLTRQEIVQGYWDKYGRPLQDWMLRQQILPMLINSGLACQESDPNDRRRALIYPTNQLTISKNQNNGEREGGGIDEDLDFSELDEVFENGKK